MNAGVDGVAVRGLVVEMPVAALFADVGGDGPETACGGDVFCGGGANLDAIDAERATLVVNEAAGAEFRDGQEAGALEE